MAKFIVAFGYGAFLGWLVLKWLTVQHCRQFVILPFHMQWLQESVEDIVIRNI